MQFRIPEAKSYVKQPVYQQENYLKLLEKHYKDVGVPFKKPDLPIYVSPPKPEVKKEPELGPPDRVYLKLRYLKNGTVRVKLDTSFIMLYERYYKKHKLPPFKSVVAAYKSFGFSEAFLERIKKTYSKRSEVQKRFEKMYESIFNKETVKKGKNKKKKEDEMIPDEDLDRDEVEVEVDDEEEEEEDDNTVMENPLDVEEEEEDLEVDAEEEYFSDRGD